MVDIIVEAVCADLKRRSEVGVAKYGKTLDRTDLRMKDWLNHAYEETLDLANYLKRCMYEPVVEMTPEAKDHLQTVIERHDYLVARIRAKKSVGWETVYDEREMTALSWAISQLTKHAA